MAREVDRLAELLAQRGGRSEVASLHRLPRFQGRSKYLDDIIREFEKQGRGERLQAPDFERAGKSKETLTLFDPASRATTMTIPEGGFTV